MFNNIRIYDFNLNTENVIIQSILPFIPPVLLLPVIIRFASLNIFCGIGIFVGLIWALICAERLPKLLPIRPHHCYVWSLVSVLYMWIFFDTSIQYGSVLKIEHDIFAWSMAAALVCFYIVSNCSFTNLFQICIYCHFHRY